MRRVAASRIVGLFSASPVTCPVTRSLSFSVDKDRAAAGDYHWSAAASPIVFDIGGQLHKREDSVWGGGAASLTHNLRQPPHASSTATKPPTDDPQSMWLPGGLLRPKAKD